MSNKIEAPFSNEILKKGIIYKCYSKSDDKVYYGSTKNLPQRMKSHSTKYNKTNSVYINGELEYEVLEEHDDINRRELEAKERIYIENHKADKENPVICINKNIPTQTSAEYHHKKYKDNCEEMKAKQRLYYWENAEKERTRLKKYYQTVKDNVSKKRKEDITFCEECKKSMRKDTIRRHNRTEGHIQNCLSKNYSSENTKTI